MATRDHTVEGEEITPRARTLTVYIRCCVMIRGSATWWATRSTTRAGYQGTGSPDRVDALVWALTDLVIARAAEWRRPRVRTLVR